MWKGSGGGGGSGVGDVDKRGIFFEGAAAVMMTVGDGGLGDVKKWGILFEVAADKKALEMLISGVFFLRWQRRR